MNELEKKITEKTANAIEQGLLMSFEEPFKIGALNKEMIISFFDGFLDRE